MNWVLIGITVFCYPLAGDSFVLGESLFSWVGHILAHADLLHLFGNMLFLWVFGNAVCAKVGNLTYPFIYFGLGLVAGFVSYAIDPHPAVGASGAINGVVGMFIVWYFLNEISCWYFFWFFGLHEGGTFSVSSFWIILLWVAFDIWNAVRGDSNIDHIAHLAGFVAGFLLAVALLKLRWVKMERGERSLLQALTGDVQKRSINHKIRRTRRRLHKPDSQ